MTRRKAANLVKGFAWLCLAAAALPCFMTSEEPTAEVTRLTIGLPWSPWLVYCESWSRPAGSTAPAPALSYQTNVEPRSWSTAALLAAIGLLLASRLLRTSCRLNRGTTPPAGARQSVLAP